MSAKFHAPWRLIASFAGATALVAWAIALAQALPRLLAGPLCTSGRDSFALAGHCPACFVAVALTLVFGASLILARGEARAIPAVIPAR